MSRRLIAKNEDNLLSILSEYWEIFKHLYDVTFVMLRRYYNRKLAMITDRIGVTQKH